MKDMYQIFDESFANLDNLIEKSSYTNCYNIAKDLTRISTLADYKDGILITEVLEKIFNEIEPLLLEYKIPEKDSNALKEELKKYVGLLSQSYKDENKTKVYEILKELRSVATQFQFQCWNILERKPGGSGYRRFVRTEVD